MKSRDTVDQLIKQLKTTASSDLDRRIDTLTHSPVKRNDLSIVPSHTKMRFVKYVAAIIVIAGVLMGLHILTGSIDGVAPAFGQVMDNIRSQAWIYMFEENRKTGEVEAEYWYHPESQRLCFKSHTGDAAFTLDLKNAIQTEYRDHRITHTNVKGGVPDWLRERMPVIDGLLTPYQERDAVITQRDATYNGQAAYLYEMEISLPQDRHDQWSTSRTLWLVDTANHLPMICERTYSRSHLKDNHYSEYIVANRRLAFDYCETGPDDIYALGVPLDTPIQDRSAKQETDVQRLTDSIEAIKHTQYLTYSAIIVKNDCPEAFIIRNHEKLRSHSLELGINYSDYLPKKEQHLEAMGTSFQAVFTWSQQSGVLRANNISLYDGHFKYETRDDSIRKNRPISMSQASGTEDQVLPWYCWRAMPHGCVTEDELTKTSGWVCTVASNGYRAYFDPDQNYFCMRTVDPEGRIRFEITETAITPGGLRYPQVCREAYVRTNRDTGERSVGYSTYHIYAADLDDSLTAMLDPNSLPNYVDPRQLTLDLIRKRQNATDPNAVSVQAYSGFTPLHMAIYRQDLDRVAQTLEQNVDLNPASDTGATPMELAVSTGSLALVSLLHQHGAAFVSHNEKRSCLGLAIELQHSEIAQYIIRSGCDINRTYKQGNTPLHYAARSGDLSEVQYLVKHDAIVDAVNDSGDTPLMLAAGECYQMINRLSVRPTELKSYEEIMRLLVQHGANIDKHSRQRWPILQRMTSGLSIEGRNTRHQLALLALLLELGADPNLIVSKSSPLYIAAEARRPDMVSLFLKHGADPWRFPGDLDYSNLNLLYWAKRWKNEGLYNVLYPYMKDRYEAVNSQLVETTQSIMRAVMSQDPSTIKRHCVSPPEQPSDIWDSWSKEIQSLFQGHSMLPDQIQPGWFSESGFADVYIPLPQGFEKKSILLGFFRHPDGSWKCVKYQALDTMPEPQDVTLSDFLRAESHYLRDFVQTLNETYKSKHEQ